MSNCRKTKSEINHDEFYRRFTFRQNQLLTVKQQKAVKETVVAVIGLGANGAPASEILIRFGFENLVLVEPDVVEISNLNSQPYALSDVGKRKADCIKKKLLKINPFSNITVYNKGLNEDNVDIILQKSDIVLDAMDNYRAKVILCRQAKKKFKTIVHTAGGGYRGAVSTFPPIGISYEELFHLPSLGRNINEVTDNEFLEHRKEVASFFGKDMYPNEYINRMNKKELFWPTLISGCLCAGSLSATEVLKNTIGHMNYLIIAPRILQFDTFRNIYKIFVFSSKMRSAW